MIGKHKKPLCEEIGHAWEPTTSSNFRKCSRSTCRLVQHQHDGQWVNVVPKARKQPDEQSQTGLWG